MAEKGKKKIRELAQDKLMHGLQIAIDQAHDESASPEVIEEMKNQFSRIEKIFGYAQGSWKRGC